MTQLETTKQAVAYLAEMSPDVTYRVNRFPLGWVCAKVLSREETARDQGLGLAKLVIDSETGIVYVYPSWSEMMVAEAFTEFKETEVDRAGRRIYPHQWNITIQRTAEDDQTIAYQLTAQSLTDPPEPTQQFPLTIDKRTYATDPTNPLTNVALSRAEAESRRNQGVWPETATIRV
ncbi:hypothetical protein [Mycolicibacterium arenosum]|uniref:Uncharacterized protein n=1 Tax=Mycolicibacterium arenosum TaxID=2952157 RepID=A0ABT1M6I0_9MYCO|nr:hypothetical protein [Mycolicibacterium sp. CAU 1645]MCP9273839.1 hypothetical protein [Mycolicibacterium sp. CAU 1645]